MAYRLSVSAARRRDFVDLVGDLAADHETSRRPEQVFEQFSFPDIPDFRAGAADVGHGEQVQCDQVTVIRYIVGEGGNDILIGQILGLRGGGKQQVVFDQPYHQLTVFFRQAVLFAEACCVGTSL